MAKISKEQVKKIADLAKIKLTDAEINKFSGEISNILDYVEQLSGVDVSDIDITSHVDDFEGEALREDSPKTSVPIDKVLQNATDGRSSGNYFKTSRIVDHE